MNYRTMRFLMMIVLIIPLTIQSMFLALKTQKYHFSRSPITRRSFCNNIQNLRSIISTPRFKLAETKKIIADFADGNRYECGAENKLIEHIVFKATEHCKSEKKYASVLRQLREHGWSKSNYCKAVMLHSAVISDLPHVTKELLRHDSNWVHETDLHGCVPIDYCQSFDIRRILKNAGSREELRYTGEDLWYRVPDYGWQEATPLRKAVYNGDKVQCLRILSDYVVRHNEDNNTQIIINEAKILLALVDLRFWRTHDKKYSEIKELIEKFYKDHSKPCSKPNIEYDPRLEYDPREVNYDLF